MRGLKWGVAAVVAIAISACQTMPQVPFDKATAGNIKNINIVEPAAPKRPRVVLASTVGQSFGLIGALIDAGMQEAREDTFEDVVKSQNYVAKDAFMKHLDVSLTEGGYTPAHDTTPRAKDDFLKEYKAPEGASTDAHFDIVMNYGYYASGLSTPYRPYVFVACKLVRASDKALLMQKFVFYNPLNAAPENSVTVPPDPTYEFADFDALKANPEKAVKGLDAAIASVASTMGTLLR